MITDLYSKRMKRQRGEMPDVYEYDVILPPLRVQVVQILEEAYGDVQGTYGDASMECYSLGTNILRREYGVFQLPPGPKPYNRAPKEELIDFFLTTRDIDRVIDVIEITFRIVERIAGATNYLGRAHAKRYADGAIDELNARLKEHGVGYQFVDGEIIRVDSELIHAEAVKPALRLLNTKNYKGAHEEFVTAYGHYRHGNIKEALNECNKAFESTMKAICDKRGWTFGPNDTASKLIGVLYDHGLVPPYWQGQLQSLRSLLESSIPTGRNRISGHGQGATPIEVPPHFAAYMLHMTASTLVFLTTSEEAIP
ncbi:hypothetical protein [Mesorhizobium sp. M0771]|uniref:STM4504/CBY_0614 family protein n=1 Tax=Mesorhizobium sp. M0771 TaxID=2956997 RepID=UPI00333C8D53